MKCSACGKDILTRDPTICPYCGSKSLMSDEEWAKKEIIEVEKLEKAGQYEEAARGYEELEMREKAEDCRRLANPDEDDSANANMGKVDTISMKCPHCGASQPIASKSNEVTCKGCGKNYVIPKKVLNLL